MSPATEAQMPEMTYTHTVTALTGTPESAAARSLPPEAYSQRPKVERLSTNPRIRAMMPMMMTPIGMPSSRLNPSQSNPVFPSSGLPERLLTVSPLVIRSAMPRTT